MPSLALSNSVGLNGDWLTVDSPAGPETIKAIRLFQAIINGIKPPDLPLPAERGDVFLGRF